MTDKRCPNCRLINPPEATRCDCGYDFDADGVKNSYVPDHLKAATQSQWFSPLIVGLFILLVTLLAGGIFFVWLVKVIVG